MGQMVPLLHNDENIHDNNIILKWIRLRSVMDTLSSNASPKIVQHMSKELCSQLVHLVIDNWRPMLSGGVVTNN